jgi:cardiolipin synthase C
LLSRFLVTRGLRAWVVLLVALLLPATALARPSQAVVLASNRDALAARMALIDKARHEINVSAFIFTPDRLGQMGLALLRAKARQGVKVRVLVDGMSKSSHLLGPPFSRALLAHLAEEGIEVRFYNSPRGLGLVQGWELMHRMHDKLLVVDGEEMILGSRNAEEGYFGLRTRPKTPLGAGRGSKHSFRDLDAWVSGDTAAEAQTYFHRLFDASHVRTPKQGAVSAADVERVRVSIDHYEQLVGRPRIAALYAVDWKANARPLASVQFIHDPIGLGGRGKRNIHRWKDLFETAEREITIVSPYWIPTRQMKMMLHRALARGIKVKFITNSRKTGENLLQAAYELTARSIAKMGVEIIEYTGPETLHAKTVLVDGKRAYLGSYNADPRSQNLNSETGIIFESAEAAGDIANFIADLERTSQRVAFDGKLDTSTWKYRTTTQQIIWPLCQSLARIPAVRGQL